MITLIILWVLHIITYYYVQRINVLKFKQIDLQIKHLENEITKVKTTL